MAKEGRPFVQFIENTLLLRFLHHMVYIVRSTEDTRCACLPVPLQALRRYSRL